MNRPIAFHLVSLVLAWKLLTVDCQAQPNSITLTDVTSRSGVDFLHTDGHKDQYFIVETLSAGVALFDFDSDGDDDIYLLNGSDFMAGVTAETAEAPRNRLYRNDGNFRFQDVTDQSGLGDAQYGLGVAVADFDNDGSADVFVNNFGANKLYRNQGDGTFVVCPHFTEFSGDKMGAGASFFDMDSDGDLDLYVANYVKDNIDNHKIHHFKGQPAYPSPLIYDPEPDQLLENLGNGRFCDISKESGIADYAGRGMGVATFDYDRDGDLDVFVANDSEANFLFKNNGGTFEESALIAGVAFDYKSNAHGSMGVELLDLDGDQLQDLYVTSFERQSATYYHNEGFGFFQDRTLQTGAYKSTLPQVTWGVVATDLDNDGNTDSFVAVGGLDDRNSARGGTTDDTGYRRPNLVLRGMSASRLQDLQQDWGTGAVLEESSRGAAAADFDLDGRIDLVVLNSRRPPQLLKNESPSQAFVQIRLVGSHSNRDGLGSIVSVTQSAKTQSKVARSGHSYQSESSKVLHFGLPSPNQPVEVSVKWFSSNSESTLQVRPNSRVLIVESIQQP